MIIPASAPKTSELGIEPSLNITAKLPSTVIVNVDLLKS